MGNLQLSHFAGQPSLPFSRKGYRAHGSLISFGTPAAYEEAMRLNYLLLAAA